MSVRFQVRFKGRGEVDEVPAEVEDQVDGPLYGQNLAQLWPDAKRVAAAAGVRGLQYYSVDEYAAMAAALGFADPRTKSRRRNSRRGERGRALVSGR